MLWRYAGSPAATDQKLHFIDADKTNGWALEALRWVTESGIIRGKGGILDPTRQVTCTETAQMLKNSIEEVINDASGTVRRKLPPSCWQLLRFRKFKTR